MTTLTLLSRNILACLAFASMGVRADKIRTIAYSAKLAKEAGWAGKESYRELADRYELWDETKQSWIPLSKSKRKLAYTPSELTDWVNALNRMYGYSLNRPTKKPGRPNGDRRETYWAFMAEARKMEAENDEVSLKAAMESLALKHGVDQREFGAAKAAERRKPSSKKVSGR
jgi:hypothetical protein